MMCMFQLVDFETGNRTEPLMCDRSDFAVRLRTFEKQESAGVLVVMEEVSEEWQWCMAPLMSVADFVKYFGVDENGREIL